MATRSKLDIASVWPMQCAWMTSRHRENDRYWRVVNAGGSYKLLQINENLSSRTNRCISDLLGMRAVERSYPRPLVGKQFYRFCLRGLCYHDKDARGASRDYGAVYQGSTPPSTSVDTFAQPPSQNQGHRTARRQSYAIYKKYCYIVSLTTYPRINPYVDILI